MSVINNMLRNLDARRVDAGSDEALPQEVLAAPRGRKPVRRGVFIAPVLLAVLVFGVLYFWPKPVVRVPQLAMIAEVAPAAPVLSAEAETLLSVEQQPATAPSFNDTAEPAPAPSTKSVLVASSVAQPEGVFAPRASKSVSAPAASRPAPSRPGEAPTAQSLPVAAPPVAVVSPTGSHAANNASIRLEPSTPTPQERNLSEVQHAADLQRRGALVEAETTLRGVLDNDKNMLPARLALVSLLSRQQRGDEARMVLKDGVDIAPTEAQLLLPYARLLAARGEWRPAYEMLVPAADVLAQEAEYRALCGAVLQRLGHFSQAAGEYRAALRLSPTAGAWWVGLGLSLEGDGRPVEARNAYVQARSNSLAPDLAQFVESKLARLGLVDQSLQ